MVLVATGCCQRSVAITVLREGFRGRDTEGGKEGEVYPGGSQGSGFCTTGNGEHAWIVVHRGIQAVGWIRDYMEVRTKALRPGGGSGRGQECRKVGLEREVGLGEAMVREVGRGRSQLVKLG